MSIQRVLFTVFLLGAIYGCGLNRTSSQTRSPVEELLRTWSAPDISVRERAAAVNRCFTNGTPIPAVVSILGTNYGVVRPFSSVWIGPGPEPRKTCSLLYDFGRDSVEIGTSADIGGDPLGGKFTGAGYSLPVTPSPDATNKAQISQPDGAANQSQPVGRETNQTSSAAGPRRPP